MEEDIILLQDFIDGKIEQDKLENYKGGYKLGFFYTKDLQQAIENLINRNKQLEADNYEQNNIINNYIEIEKEHKKENGKLRERIKEFEEKAYKKEYYEEVAEELYKNSIPKSKVREKIEELKEDIQYSANPLSIDNSKFGIYLLESILQEGDK